jgi:hypothetical protein
MEKQKEREQLDKKISKLKSEEGGGNRVSERESEGRKKVRK